MKLMSLKVKKARINKQTPSENKKKPYICVTKSK